eukprot:COSAG02_NODE_1522_length_12158_cov_23.675263_4_plen_88_part_00
MRIAQKIRRDARCVSCLSAFARATQSGRVAVARAVQIHVPTIGASTCDRNGRLQGNRMAQVPISMPEMDEWVAAADIETHRIAQYER